jgi:dipeptidyl aminopeptidase/acylaminoacyl peptidase
VPWILIHGREDWRTDRKQAIRMKTALRGLGKPVELLSLRGDGFGAYGDNSQLQVYEAILEFLDRHLMPLPSEAN